jgi:hypothetical protein
VAIYDGDEGYPRDRTADMRGLRHTIMEAEEYVYISVMDFMPG